MDPAGAIPELEFLNFSAAWAEQCTQINDVFDALVAQNRGSVPVLKRLVRFETVDVDDAAKQDLVDRYNIESVPEIILVRNGRVSERVLGADPLALTRLVNRVLRQAETDHLAANTPAVSVSTAAAAGQSVVSGGGGDGHPVHSPDVARPQSTASSVSSSPAPADGLFAAQNSSSGRAAATGSPTLAVGRDAPRLDEALSNRIKAIIGTAALMVFIRGTREDPLDEDSREVLALLAGAFPDVTLATFDLDRDPAVRGGLKIFSDWPTHPQAYLRGEFLGGLDVLKRMAASGELSATLERAGLTQGAANLERKMRSLVRCSPLMLFIKGTPDAPQCGFTRTLLALLHQHFPRVPYTTFDILEDPEVRQGLKAFSSWPTFPQLYLNGEFLGGLDVFKEMLASGEMASMLRAAKMLDD